MPALYGLQRPMPVLEGTVLKLVSEGVNLYVGPCGGERTFANAWPCLPKEVDYGLREENTRRRGEPTPKTRMQVYEIVQNIRTSQLVKLVSQLSGELWLQEDQIIEFSEKQCPYWMAKPRGEISRTYFFL